MDKRQKLLVTKYNKQQQLYIKYHNLNKLHIKQQLIIKKKKTKPTNIIRTFNIM